MKRLSHGLIVASLVFAPLAVQAADSAGLTREQVRADLIAAELSGKFPQNKGNKRDPAMFYTAKKATQKPEKDISGVSAPGNVTAAPAASAY